MDLSVLLSSSLNPLIRNPRRRHRKTYRPLVAMATPSSSGDSISAQKKKAPKLVTFIGKGGSGKTTASVLASRVISLLSIRSNCINANNLFFMYEFNFCFYSIMRVKECGHAWLYILRIQQQSI